MQITINVICANDSVESVVPLPEKITKIILEKLAMRHYSWSEFHYGTYREYRQQVYWHIHKVPVRVLVRGPLRILTKEVKDA